MESNIMANRENTRVGLFDLHCDTLDRLALHGSPEYPACMEHDEGMPAARMSSLVDNDADIAVGRMGAYEWCQCFAIFIPDELGGEAAWNTYRKVQRFFAAQLSDNEKAIEQVRDARDIDGIVGDGRCAAMLTLENSSILDKDLQRVEILAGDGVKMATLTWNASNALASGHDTTQGLSSFGRRAVASYESAGIAVDVSHLNDKGFSDFYDIATRPFAASHSNMRAVCAHKRNLTDAQFRAIVDAKGIAGINFCVDFLVDGGGDVTRDDMLRHVDHALELGGEHALALGSDYDGADVPRWLQGEQNVVELYRLLVKEFGADIANAVFFENARDFFVRNERD